MGGIPLFSRWNLIIAAGLGAILLNALLSSCTPPESIRIGFVGGLSGRVADLGIAGRNGAQLAVELRNQAGGVAGRPVELIIRDDVQKPEIAERVMRELIAQGVVAIVGPMTSAMAMRMTPVANDAKIIMMSPTVTTNDLSGLDDYFFRVTSSTRVTAVKSALYQRNVRHMQQVVAVYDLSNQSYTENWLNEFRAAFTQNGGEMVKVLGFESGSDTAFLPIVRNLLVNPVDGVVIIANSVDAALLCQQIRKLDSHVPIVVAEWGATERLVELGGKTVEGVTTAQIFDRNNTSPLYQMFYQSYRDRFGHEPGFGGTAAFDAANVVLDALARQPPGQNLKQTVLAMRRFAGVQNPVIFDDFGDAQRKIFITTVSGGRFIVAE
ncbi:MAG: ABC transporter substrate-binding protein [Candidatus Competibacter sp.]|nr:ABC transporter substrate-binding protein [Candidatus Competibacter sp.]MDG4606114.1 ABC transporter substrate-binding protein [Candidatus Contendobacter sp.]HRD49636.1 ABC transporter substrate-binding protein [Candidatus Contendobacter sp.]